jgi:type IV pilus assembly protein PilX
MIRAIATSGQRQRGVVLISAMLLLLVLTIFALSMFRSFGLQQKIAGNVREKQRSLQAAEGAQQYAETWLAQLNTITPAKVPCTALAAAAWTNVQVCSNAMTSTSAVSWPWSGGFTYTPPTNTAAPTFSYSTTAPTYNTYFGLPTFYISDLGVSADGTGEVYQIDAWGYGASANTVSVVESTYLVKPTVRCLSC